MFWKDWYSWFVTTSNTLVDSIYGLSGSIEIPILVALLLGLAGATAPCQISTNIGALGYVARYTGDGDKTINQTLAFVAGKVLAYSLIGGTVIFLGTQMEVISQHLIPIVQVIRRFMGPVFIVSGLFMFGLFKFHHIVGEGLQDSLLRIVPKEGLRGAFLLGIIFSLAFCPTLFLLFFGILVPLGINSTGGIFFPAVFAVGTAIPLLFLAYLLALGSDLIRKKYVRNAGKINRIITKIAAFLFLLIGINDTLLYWNW